MLRRIPAANAIICSKVSFDGKFIRCASIPLKRKKGKIKSFANSTDGNPTWLDISNDVYHQKKRYFQVLTYRQKTIYFFSWLKLFVGSSLTIFFLSNVHSTGYTEDFGPNIKVKSIEPCLLDVERDHVRSDIGRFILRNVSLVTTEH